LNQRPHPYQQNAGTAVLPAVPAGHVGPSGSKLPRRNLDAGLAGEGLRRSGRFEYPATSVLFSICSHGVQLCVLILCRNRLCLITSRSTLEIQTADSVVHLSTQLAGAAAWAVRAPSATRGCSASRPPSGRPASPPSGCSVIDRSRTSPPTRSGPPDRVRPRPPIRHPPHTASTPRPTTAATAAARTRSRLLPGCACVCEHAQARR
jgi:hypothetical protein